MATHHIGSGNSGLNTTADSDTWILDAGDVLSVADDNAFLFRRSNQKNELIVRGTMETTADFNTILIQAARSDVTVDAGGVVTSGRTAIYSTGEDCQVSNSGTIEAVAFGARFYEDDSHMVNHGSVVSDNTGVSFGGNLSSLRNDGSISGIVGVSVTTSQGSFELINEGTIEGTKYAFVGNTTADTVTNSGTIEGGVYLRSGNDVFISDGGTVTETVYGGNGNDSFRLGDDVVSLVELSGGGIDSVFSAASYVLGDFLEKLTLTGSNAVDGTGNSSNNTLIGNSAVNVLLGAGGRDIVRGGGGNDHMEGGAAGDRLAGSVGHDVLLGDGGFDRLVGGGGRDHLTGGIGNDTLNGGGGRDYFIFADGFGSDKITDFLARGVRHDLVDLTGLTNIISYTDLKTNHMHQEADGVVIVDGSNRILLEGVDLADLVKGDFLF
jgi:Ca2+-binding RTX toxin-like protein